MKKEPPVSALEQTDGLAHRRLEVERLDVLPVLLKKRNKEVDAQHSVREHLVISHLDVADGNAQTQDLLQLELDGRAHLGDLVGEIFSVRDGCGELASLGQTGTKETRDLLDKSLGCQEGIVLLGKLLDELFILVELLQIVHRHIFELDLLGTIDVSCICKNADGHARTGDVGKLDGSGETLIPLRIVVLKANLKLNSLHKVTPLFAVGICKEILDHAPHACH